MPAGSRTSRWKSSSCVSSRPPWVQESNTTQQSAKGKSMRPEQSQKVTVLAAKMPNSMINADDAPRFKHQLNHYVSNGHRPIVLNIEAVSLIDSSGLGALVSSLKAIRKDGDLVLCGTGGTVV